MKIIKFGRSCIKDINSLSEVLEVVKNEPQPVVVVVSAMNEVLSRLETISEMAMVGDNSYKPILKNIEDEHFALVKHFIDVKHQAKVIAGLKVILNDLEEILYGVYLLWELSPRTRDHIYSFGVKMCAYLVGECLNQSGTQAQYIDARHIIVTNDYYGHAVPLLDDSYEKIKQLAAKSAITWVLTGGIGATERGESSYLGKSGATYTASMVAHALNARSIEIYTDRNGIFNADPMVVENAYSLPEVTYNEVMEMANFGNSFVYPQAIQPAVTKNIPIVIKNLFDKSFKGSNIVPKTTKGWENPIKASSSIPHVSLINIQGSGMLGISGIAARVFNTLAQEQISVALITQASSEHSICIAVMPHQGTKAQLALQHEFVQEIREKKMDNISLTKDLSIIAIIGENMKQVPGVAGNIFQVLGQHGINVKAIAQGSSESNISVVVEKKDLSTALQALQKHLF